VHSQTLYEVSMKAQTTSMAFAHLPSGDGTGLAALQAERLSPAGAASESRCINLLDMTVEDIEDCGGGVKPSIAQRLR
jgi:hypothetical protein